MVETLDKKLGESNESMRSQIGESNTHQGYHSATFSKVNETNKQARCTQLKTIQNILMNPKQRGVQSWGVFFGNGLRKNVFTSRAYSMQYKFNDGDIADAVIFFGKADRQTITD